MARASGSTHDGSPLVFATETGLVAETIETAIDTVVLARRQTVGLLIEDDPRDAVDATAFVSHIEVNSTAPGCSAGASSDTDGDGLDDTFTDVVPGDTVCFDVVAATNGSAPATDAPQLFPVAVTAFGDGAPLDRARVVFIVPEG